MIFNTAKKEIENLKKKLDFQQSAIDKFEQSRAQFWVAHRESQTAKFSVDFNKLDVFSIERITRSRDYAGTEFYVSETVLGYWNQIGSGKEQVKEVGEWYLECSIEEHNRLVDEFEKTRSKKK